MSLSATIPIAHMDAANVELVELGHGPCFAVPLRTGQEAATHAGFHAWDDPAFQAAIEALDYPGLVIRHDAGRTVNFSPHVQQQALEWSDPTDWSDNPIMTGDQRTHGGKTWESLIDTNVWQPPVGWREVVEDGYPEWIAPTGAHDAYQTGDRVSYEGADYESTIDGNVWSPTDYPQGWEVIE